MTKAEAIEAVALTLYNAYRVRRGMDTVDSIGANLTRTCGECREDASAVLTALRAGGWHELDKLAEVAAMLEPYAVWLSCTYGRGQEEPDHTIHCCDWGAVVAACREIASAARDWSLTNSFEKRCLEISNREAALMARIATLETENEKLRAALKP